MLSNALTKTYNFYTNKSNDISKLKKRKEIAIYIYVYI